MAASVRRLRSQSSEVRRRDVLLAVLFAIRKKHGGVLLKDTCDVLVPRGAAAADAKTARRAAVQYLQEAVDFGVLTKDSRRRYRFTNDVRRYAEAQGNTASKNKKKKRSKNAQADVGADSGSSTSGPSASEADVGAATLTSDVAPGADEITVEMLRVNIGVQRGDERLATTSEAPVGTGDADLCTEEVVFDIDVIKDESKDPLFCAKLEKTSSPAPTVIHLESGHNHEEDVKLFN